MHLIESSSNKLSSIPEPIPTLGATTNEVSSPSMGLNDANIRRSSRKNAIAINSLVGNEGTEESNGDAKIRFGSTIKYDNNGLGLLSAYYCYMYIGIRLSYRCLSLPSAHLVCGGRLSFSRVKFLSCMPLIEFVALSIKFFKNTQDVSIYEGFFAIDDLDNN